MAVTGSGEAGAVVSEGIEGTGRKLDAATRTGAGEAGSVVSAGVEGTGSIRPITRTGAAEAGVSTSSGIEGTGSSVVPPPVTEQTFDLGTFDAEFGWAGAILIEPALVAGGATAYLRSVEEVGTNPRIRISSTADGDATDAGPDLSDEWETYADAITLHRDGADDLVLKGPNNPDNSFSDPAEPYFWIPDNGTEFAAWWDQDIDFTNFLLTFKIPAITFRTGSGEPGEVTASGAEGTGRKLDAATRTGSGEDGSVAASGKEGAGRSLDAATRTGAGEAGEVDAAGIEGAGRKISAGTRTGSGEPGEVTAAGIEGTGRKLDAATRTGGGEAGEVSAAGVEGTGQAIPVVVRTGSGEPGEVAVAGIEGTGRSIATLLLSDWSTPSGQVDVFVGLIEIGVSGEDRYNEGSVGSLVAGSLDLTADATFNRVRLRSGPTRVTINRPAGDANLEGILEAGGELSGGTIYVQDLDGTTAQAIADIGADRIFGGSVNLDESLNSAFYDTVNDLAAGERLILAFTSPAEPVTGSGEGRRSRGLGG